MRKLFLIFITVICAPFFKAQPLTLKSVGEIKEFRLKLYYGTGGKGAFVQYEGKKGIIPLRVNSYRVDTIPRKYNQPDHHYFEWNEMVDGKWSGIYKMQQIQNVITDVSYTRLKNGKKFELELADDDEKPDGEDQYLLHGAVISFNHFYNNKLLITYPDGKKMNAQLPFPDSPDPAQQSIIEDYNFDGYDDLAFTIPDAGMGVYSMFTIYLYHPKKKRFEKLTEPDYSKSACSCLCDVSVNRKDKLLQTACRGGASWHEDSYRFDKNGSLKWVFSSVQKE